jgi:hypothetical protein
MSGDWGSLPEAVLANIANKAVRMADITNARLACKQWLKGVVPTTLNLLRFDNTALYVRYAKFASDFNVKVSVLELDECKDMKLSTLKCCGVPKGITSLSIESDRLGGVFLRADTEALSSVETFYTWNLSLDDISLLSRMPRLTDLYLDDTDMDFTAEHLHRIAESAPRLESLAFGSPEFSRELVAGLSRMTNLVKLYMRLNNYNDDQYAFATSVQIPSVTELDLTYSTISDDMLATIVSVFPRTKRLTLTPYYRNRFTRQGLHHLLKLRDLEVVHIYHWST